VRSRPMPGSRAATMATAAAAMTQDRSRWLMRTVGVAGSHPAAVP